MHKRRKGRPRKSGSRHSNGHLKRIADPADSPRLIAASQPHRRGLGDQALDPQAECELGRMRLRNQITEPQMTAGEFYARLWRGYVSTLNSPREPGEGQGHVGPCSGCSDPASQRYCACDLRRRLYAEAAAVLIAAGPGVSPQVQAVVVLDRLCASVPLLKLGLTALAEHYGLIKALTNHRKRAYQNALSQRVAPAT